MPDEPKIRLQSSDGWTIQLPVSRLPLTFGRLPGNDIEIPDANVSRLHCGLEWRDGSVHLVDLESANGTVVGDRRLGRGESLPLTSDALLVLGSVIVRILVDGAPSSQPAASAANASEEEHGICLVDVCDSTELPREHVDLAARWMRDGIIGIAPPSDLLLIKNLGDGYLAVFKQPAQAIAAARKLLWLRAQQTPSMAVDIRVTLDRGPTFRSSTSDRIGLVINRAARIEKTQRVDVEEPSPSLDALLPRNRCIGSDAIVADATSEWTFVGRRRLKGFGERTFGIHQLTAKAP